jgi:hypothetical protein
MKRHVLFLLLCSSTLIFSCSKNSTDYTSPGGPPNEVPTIVPQIWPVVNDPYNAVLDGSQAFNTTDVIQLKVYTTVMNDTLLSGTLTFTDIDNSNNAISTMEISPIDGNPDIRMGTDYSSGFGQNYLMIITPLNSNLANKRVGLSLTLRGLNTQGSTGIEYAFNVNP